MHIVQLAPYIGVGSGVAGVAANLEREFRAAGHTVESFTTAIAENMEPRRRKRQRAIPTNRMLRAFGQFRDMVWFTLAGTARARRFLAERPGAVAICHNSLMTGDVYVNHGVVSAAMRARGHGTRRMLANPTHPFTFVRDLIRYRCGIHRVVVVLSKSETATLERTYGRVRSEVRVIPNGVDLERFHPPDSAERSSARAQFQLDDDDRVALFVGHEFGRKGLDVAIAGLVQAPTVLLLVVGGNAQRRLDEARAFAARLGVAERVLFLGTRSDLPELFAASDMFVLPSAYEANALVLLEALAAGLPVVATRVGYAPEIVLDGVNGYLVERDPAEIGERLEELAAHPAGSFSTAARASVEGRTWAATARLYLELAEDIAAGKAAAVDASASRHPRR
jgi:UDP-glucose:(heptosyl)LPS alpha-1,3-glucosyltransferase